MGLTFTFYIHDIILHSIILFTIFIKSSRLGSQNLSDKGVLVIVLSLTLCSEGDSI
jgi:hypothetical protein